jgi:hypothetical protein
MSRRRDSSGRVTRIPSFVHLNRIIPTVRRNTEEMGSQTYNIDGEYSNKAFVYLTTKISELV